MRINLKLKYLGIILGLITGYFFLLNFSSWLEGHTVCIFKIATGVPCPACGSIRATLLLMQGEIWESVLTNPLGIVTNIVIIISIIWMIIDILKHKETYVPFLQKDWNKKIKITVFLIIIANWIWNIEKGL